MKKVLSIAISSLLVGNFAYADTPNEDLLVTIQKKIEARKSGLGSDVQTSSGLASVNKPKAVTTEIKDSTVNLPVKNVSSDKKEEVLTADKKEIKVETNKSSPVLVKNNIEKSVNDIPLNTVVKPNTPENCETPKVKVVKHTVKKSKPVVKNTKPLKNDFEMYKTKNYTPLDFSEKKNNWMTNQQVKISISGEKNDINVNISDLNDKAISSEQLNNLNLRVVQVPQDFSGIYNQIKLLDSNSINYSFDKKIDSCGVVFVQYQLKSNSTPVNLVKYLDSNGNWTNKLDSSCEVKLPKDSATNIEYSSNNNLSGIFFDKDKFIANKAFNFNIIFNKFGVNKTPTDLFVYAINKDLSDFKVIGVKSYGNAVTGTYFETFLDKGSYVLGYTFNEGKTENYFKNINVQ